MSNRFESRRAAGVSMEVITSAWDAPVALVAEDLSPRGAYVASDYQPREGEHIVCCFSLGAPKEYCFFAEVKRINRRRRKSDPTRGGFGVSFLDSSPLDRLALRHALCALPEPTPSRRTA